MIAFALSIVSLVCLRFLARAAHDMFRTYRHLETGRYVIGTVCGYREPDDEGGEQSVVSFEVDGREHFAFTHIASSPPSHRIGEELPVVYAPEDPDRNLIPTFGDTYGSILLGSVMPLIVLICALAGLFGTALLRCLYPSLF
ncbi:MAG: DUF3592 domain-containing protein [Pseudomonadota bacterium]